MRSVSILSIYPCNRQKMRSCYNSCKFIFPRKVPQVKAWWWLYNHMARGKICCNRFLVSCRPSQGGVTQVNVRDCFKISPVTLSAAASALGRQGKQ